MKKLKQSTFLDSLRKVANPKKHKFNKEKQIGYFKSTNKDKTRIIVLEVLTKTAEKKGDYIGSDFVKIIDFANYLYTSTSMEQMTCRVSELSAFLKLNSSKSVYKVIKKEFPNLENSLIKYEDKRLTEKELNRQGITKNVTSDEGFKLFKKLESYNGLLRFELSEEFKNILDVSYNYEYPTVANMGNFRQFPHLYYTTHAICLNAVRNQKNLKRATSMKVSTLLESVPTLTKDKRFKERVKEPFKKNFDKLKELDFLDEWKLVDDNYKELKKEEWNKLKPNEFYSSTLIYNFSDDHYKKITQK